MARPLPQQFAGIALAKTARSGVFFGVVPSGPYQTDTGVVVDKLVTQRDLALQLRISERTLERHRVNGTGPKFVRVGRLVRYRVSDVEQWLQLAVRSSTSDRHSTD